MISLPVKMHREPILCTIRGGVAVNKQTDPRLQMKNLCASWCVPHLPLPLLFYTLMRD